MMQKYFFVQENILVVFLSETKLSFYNLMGLPRLKEVLTLKNKYFWESLVFKALGFGLIV